MQFENCFVFLTNVKDSCITGRKDQAIVTIKNPQIGYYFWYMFYLITTKLVVLQCFGMCLAYEFSTMF